MINQLKLTPPEKLEKETENEVLAAFFPKGKGIRWKEIIDAETPPFEMEELKEAVYGDEEGEGARYGRTDGRNMERRNRGSRETRPVALDPLSP